MKTFKYIIAAVFLTVLFAGSSSASAAELGTKQALAAKTPIDSRIQTFVEKMADIYETIVYKLEDQADRVGKTIVRLDQGTDTDLSDAKDQLAVARLKIRAARKSVVTLDSSITTILKKGGSPRLELKEIRDEISDISDKIIDAHNALQYTVVIIKQEFGLEDDDSSSGGISNFATSTATSTIPTATSTATTTEF